VRFDPKKMPETNEWERVELGRIKRINSCLMERKYKFSHACVFKIDLEQWEPAGREELKAEDEPSISMPPWCAWRKNSP
jgi:hypothetical protein